MTPQQALAELSRPLTPEQITKAKAEIPQLSRTEAIATLRALAKKTLNASRP